MIRITIETDNDAFTPEPDVEVVRILRGLADHFEDHGLRAGPVLDVNGNTAGRVEVSL